ncbi:MAG: C40 family peptidase [Christensenellaceae bacterium]|nr:C40 family peptidase [Christensenellaceae bacterium]
MYNEQKKRTSKRTNFAVIAAALAVIAIAVSVLLICRTKTPYFILTNEQIEDATQGNEYASVEQRVFIESALSLVGKVSYFWGGKCYKIGPDEEWGTPRRVTGKGHSTSNTVRPYGLDCSGFVSWCYIQLGHTKREMVDSIGSGTWNQWEKSTAIDKRDVRLGDLAFKNKYPEASGNHIGICVGFLENGEPLIAHCSYSQNNVVVSTCGDEFIYFRRPGFWAEDE